MKVNNKAQAGILVLIFSLIIFICIWAVWLEKFLKDYGARAIEINNLVGIEAFFMANLNLWLWLMVIISIVWIAVAGANN